MRAYSIVGGWLSLLEAVSESVASIAQVESVEFATNIYKEVVVPGSRPWIRKESTY